MENIFFKQNATHNAFSWDILDNIKEGRGDMGEDMPVLVYRLMQYTMLDVLTKAHGEKRPMNIFVKRVFWPGWNLPKIPWI